MFVATILLLQLAATPPLDLEVNDARLIPLPRGAVVSVENGKVVAASDAGQGELLLEGLGPGDARLVLTIGKKVVVHAVHVVPSARAKKVAELRALLGPRNGLSVGIERDGTPWVECPTCDFPALQKMNDALALFRPVRFVDVISRANPDVVMKGVVAILGANAEDGPGLTLDVRDGRVFLLGALRTEEDRRRVALASLRFPAMRVHVEPELHPFSSVN